MKSKLAAFESFCVELYPHELDYLISVQQFQKEENLKILNLIHYNSKNPDNRLPFDKSIDKRTYSYMKTWIQENLEKIDVDIFYRWLSEIEQSIMNDSIQSNQEVELLKKLDEVLPTSYYFMKFFRVLQHYRDYLIVRNRPRNYAKVSNYLERFKINYFNSQQLNNKMNEAAEKVIFKKIWVAEEFETWEKLFSDIYYNDSIDGYTRYRALVRLTILYYTNREFDKLRMVYQHLDIQFKRDVFYSKRILANYYANRAMMHSKLNELNEAEKYGFLSIRYRNSDYLFYLINLCDVLLRQGKNEKALEVMVESFPELKKSGNLYYRIGFVSFYIKTLVANNQCAKAIDYADGFLNAYKKEIFEFRWHLFFTSYIDALFHAEKYSKIISLVRRYKLIPKEKQMKETPQYLPIIQLYHKASEYMEGVINSEGLKQAFIQHINEIGQNRFRHKRVLEVLKTIENNLPDIVHDVIRENRIL